MSASLPPIWFYIPAPAFHAMPPRSLAEYRVWANEAHQRHFSGVGKFNWILQTWYRLRAAGFPCGLINRMPQEGVVVTHRYFLPDTLLPGPRQYLVCVLADKEEPGDTGRHPHAHTHLVQNPLDPMLTAPDEAWHACYVPFWTQIDLVPRPAERGDRFENIGFFGIEANLAEELRREDWRDRVRARGMTFTRVTRDRWHDYSEMDLVLGIRSFGDQTYHWKPATKLHNAWLAGVPAIMGRDSACAAERKGPLAYLEVRSPEELEAAIDRLAASPELRRQMADNGRQRGAEVTPERITRRWRDFLVEIAAPRHRAWCALSPAAQAELLARRQR